MKKILSELKEILHEKNILTGEELQSISFKSQKIMESMEKHKLEIFKELDKDRLLGIISMPTLRRLYISSARKYEQTENYRYATVSKILETLLMKICYPSINNNKKVVIESILTILDDNDD